MFWGFVIVTALVSFFWTLFVKSVEEIDSEIDEVEEIDSEKDSDSDTELKFWNGEADPDFQMAWEVKR